MRQKKADVWLEYTTPEGMCGLCGQSGRIDTRPLNLRTAAGVPCGVVRYCICPNGRALAEQDRAYWDNLPFKAGDPRPAEASPTNTKPDVEQALDVAFRYAQIDGDHHKGWVIDQMVRNLTGINYDQWVKEYQDGEDGPQTYEWDTGIAP